MIDGVSIFSASEFQPMVMFARHKGMRWSEAEVATVIRGAFGWWYARSHKTVWFGVWACEVEREHEPFQGSRRRLRRTRRIWVLNAVSVLSSILRRGVYRVWAGTCEARR